MGGLLKMAQSFKSTAEQQWEECLQEPRKTYTGLQLTSILYSFYKVCKNLHIWKAVLTKVGLTAQIVNDDPTFQTLQAVNGRSLQKVINNLEWTRHSLNALHTLMAKQQISFPNLLESTLTAIENGSPITPSETMSTYSTNVPETVPVSSKTEEQSQISPGVTLNARSSLLKRILTPSNTPVGTILGVTRTGDMGDIASQTPLVKKTKYQQLTNGKLMTISYFTEFVPVTHYLHEIEKK